MNLWKGLILVLLQVPAASLLAAGTSEALIHVKVEVDYGSRSKPALKKNILLKPGSSVVDATRAVAEVKQGVVCCDPRDVEAIGGVKCQPQNKSWWIYDLNGQKRTISAFRCLVVEGDRVTWHYRKVESSKVQKTTSCPLSLSK